MKKKSKTEIDKGNAKTDKAKPFMVRLKSAKHRKAYEHFCHQNGRSLDAQARLLIIRELTKHGYKMAD